MTKRNFKTACYLIGMSAALLLFYSPNIYSQANWFKAGSDPGNYKMGVDSSIQHDGKKAMTIKSIDPEIQDFGTYMQNFKADQYLGKRVRMTGYMKSNDVANWAGFWLRVDQADPKQVLSFDNMQDRAIKGTTDWKKYEIILDVPGNASNIAFGALLAGTGQIWFDNLNFEIVDSSVPTTGQRKQE